MSDLTPLAGTRIPLRYSRTLLIRGMAIWILVRLGVLALYTFIAASGGPSPDVAAAFTYGNPVLVTAWTVVLSAVLVRFDLYRRHEIALLNNLGVLTSHAIALGTLPAVVMECTLAILR